jgi:hypothetical protein
MLTTSDFNQGTCDLSGSILVLFLGEMVKLDFS